ncbi:MAG: polyphosphate kinase 1 [Bacteroidetes bacterium]|nr:MAG: polyphosphate kinase 1 [Bacteroidota bacterium]
MYNTNNRELSWIDFNGRVLQEANDKSNPIIERIRFLGIFSNNRDEFFKVRIATLRRMILLAKKNSDEQIQLSEELEKTLSVVGMQEVTYTDSFTRIIKELKNNNISIINEKSLNINQELFIEDYFREVIQPNIFPIILDNFNAAQMLNDSIIYMAVNLSSTKEEKKDLHLLIEVPDYIPRFHKLEDDNGQTILIFIEDIIRYNLLSLFAKYNYDSAEGYIIKFTRDSELDIDNDVSKSFIEVMSESVKKRYKGIPIRFIYDNKIPKTLLSKLIKKLNITTQDYHTRGGGRYHNLKDLMNFPVLKPELIFNKLQQIFHPDLPRDKQIFSQIRKKDILLNFPYHSYYHIIDLLREASIDPKVKSIKMTFYRVNDDSLVMNALISAARNGKRVKVYMEIQARFNEKSNILWTQKLQREGITILPTIPGMKVHAKLILIRRKQSGKDFYYTNVSTGNFHESTSKVYSDFSLLTANQKIGKDALIFFELIESRYIPPKMNTLQVSPFNIRSFLESKIKREILNKKKGKDAWIIFKVNNLVDTAITNLIYKASESGVKIDLNIRGINIVKSGTKGISKNINAYSIVGRFLEHSRIFVFANNGEPEVYLSSADIMSRNLNHRFEVVCPVFDKDLKTDIINILDIQRNDTEKYRSLNVGEINSYTRKNKGFKKLNSQEYIYEYWKNKQY